MDNISKDIENMIFSQEPNYLHIESDHEQYIRQCLDFPEWTNIESLFHFVTKVHQKEALFDLLAELWRYENAFDEILPNHRDHYRHSANVYALGLAIYNTSDFFRESLKVNWHPQVDNERQKASFLFRWSLASIFHDLAYPLQISLECFNDYSSKIQSQNSNQHNFIDINPDIWQNLNLLPMLEPNIRQEEDTGIGLIASSMTKKQPERSPLTYVTLASYLQRTINSNLKQGKVDHGVFAALILLKQIHKMYQTRSNWPSSYFYDEIVDASLAIFLHKFFCDSELLQILGNSRYRYDYPSPIGFLLYVCDTMCEWSRKTEAQGHLFRVSSNNHEIVFRVDERFRDNMAKEISTFDERAPLRVEWTHTEV